MKRNDWTKGTTNRLLIATLVVGIVAILMSGYVILNPQVKIVTIYKNTTAVPGVHGYNITGSLLEPPTSLPSAPVVTQNQSFGHRLTNINAQFNSTELSVINNAPNSYFERAGEMWLNGTLTNQIGGAPHTLPLFTVNGKPTVIYVGSITCIFCGENRWPMAMALSRFGSFSTLFKGYSSFNDGDLPTIYWSPAHYNESSTELGNFYQSSNINFISIEDANPITAGFNLNPISTIQQRVNASNNTAYTDAMAYVVSTNQFTGTPFTVWGAYELPGADAIVFANNTTKESIAPMQNMTHEDLLRQLSQFNDQFSWSEYAAADMYVAMVCSTLNNTPSVCSAIPAIPAIEAKLGL